MDKHELVAEVLPALRGGLSQAEREELDALLSSFSEQNLRFIATRLHTDTDKKAYERLPFTKGTELRRNSGPARINRAVWLMQKATLMESHMLSIERICRLVPKAIDVLEELLDNDLPWLRRQAAIDILQTSSVAGSSKAIHEDRPIEVNELAKWIAAARLVEENDQASLTSGRDGRLLQET